MNADERGKDNTLHIRVHRSLSAAIVYLFDPLRGADLLLLQIQPPQNALPGPLRHFETLFAVELQRRRIFLRGPEPSLQNLRSLLSRVCREARQKRRLQGPPDHPATHQEAIDLADLAIDPGDGYADQAVIGVPDRKSTRLNSSHRCISYAVFC